MFSRVRIKPVDNMQSAGLNPAAPTKLEKGSEVFARDPFFVFSGIQVLYKSFRRSKKVHFCRQQ